MRSSDERRIEDLLGRPILAPDGTVAGRIEEMYAVREGNYYVVSEFHIGPGALLERIGVRHFAWVVRRRVRGYRARWNQVDLTDRLTPRLRCPVGELEKTQ